MIVRGGRGLGDSLYVRCIADELVRRGEKVCVLADYPDVFHGSGVTVKPFERIHNCVVAHYVDGKRKPDTTQWQDVCKSAKVEAPLRFTWNVKNDALVRELRDKANGKPLILVHGGREPMDRSDGFGLELVPQKAAFDAVLVALADCFLVQIGKAKQIYPLTVDVDLNGSTSVSDLLDLASVCDGVVAQCSFAIPLAEVFDKPLLAVWSNKAAKSNTEFIRQVTPQKLLSAPKDAYVIDHWPAAMLREDAREFRYLV